MAQKKEKTTICEAAITVMAFSPDYKRIAFSPNNHLVHLTQCSEKTDCAQWSIQHTLDQHGQAVTGIAWGKQTNRILSCAQDRTAFVWSESEDGTWIPCHVLLDAAVKRGLTSCAWNASENRVFIGSAACNVAVGRYDDPNPFWSCVVISPHVSTVTCLAAHPTQDRCIATGSSDCTVKITLTKGRNPEPVVTLRGTGWINSLKWSPSGAALCFATHGGEVHTATGNSEDFSTFVNKVVRLPSLPLRSVAYVNEEVIIGAGYDFYPIGFQQSKADPTQWEVAGKFVGAPKALKKEMSATELARARFQNEASTGQQQAVELPDTKHTNTISYVLPLPEGGNYAFATSSMDGRVEYWSLEELQ